MPTTTHLPIRSRATIRKHAPISIMPSEKRRHQLFRMDSNDTFLPPFSEMSSIQATTEIMRIFEAGYIRELEKSDEIYVLERPFPPESSRPEALSYVRRAIDLLQVSSEPRLLDLESLPTIDEADAEQIMREIGDTDTSQAAQANAIRLWTEIHCQYTVKRNAVSRWRDDWTRDLTRLVDQYYDAFGELTEEEQRLFLRAFEVANPEKPVRAWIASLGPQGSLAGALARASISS